jgi:hypothetical protein
VLDATDILVAGHGAMIALFVFLPRRSVIVDISSAAAHRQMNVHAAKTLTHLKLQTLSVSGPHTAEQQAECAMAAAHAYLSSLCARLALVAWPFVYIGQTSPASKRIRWVCNVLQVSVAKPQQVGLNLGVLAGDTDFQTWSDMVSPAVVGA